MYNKLFSKILDSSIWLETDSTRIIWLTLIASMDEDGFCPFAAVGNLAQRAIVSIEKTKEAIDILESPDKESGDPSNGGRRIERVNGGWVVLNAGKYRDMVTKAIIQEQTRKRVADFRERKRNECVTQGNATVTTGNENPKNVTQSRALSISIEEQKPSARKARGPVSKQSQKSAADGESRHKRIEGMIKQAWEEHNPKAGPCPWGPGDGNQLKVLLGKTAKWPDTHFAQCLMNLYASEGFPRSELPVHFLPRLAGYFAGPRNTFNREVNGNGSRRNGKLTSDEIKAEIDAAAEHMAAQSPD